MNISVVDLNVCRVCLKQNSLSKISDNKIFTECTSLEILENDGLPPFICNRCNARLKVAYEFRQEASSSDRYLRSLISSINSQLNEVTKISRSNLQNVTEILLDEIENQEIPLEETQDDPIDETVENIKQTDFKYESIEYIDAIESIPDNDNDNGDDNDDKQSYIEVDGQDSSETHEVNEISENPKQKEDDADYYDEGINKEYYTIEDSIISEYEVANIDTNPITLKEEIDEESSSNVEKSKTTKRRLPHTKLVNDIYICTKCNKDFSSSSNLSRHALIHEGVKPFICTICKKSFTQMGSLKKHILTHTGERAHICSVCGRGFTQKTSLVLHMRRHTGETPFHCEHCEKRFKSRDCLRRHLRDHNSLKDFQIKSEIFICTICNRQLASNNALENHLERHNRNNPLKNKSSKHLKQTKKFTTEKNESQCSRCLKQFGKISELMLHLKIHAENEDAICINCNKSFESKDNLQKHISICHINNSSHKTYKCHVCGKQYTIKQNFIEHLKTHESKSSLIYTCTDCNTTFNVLHQYNLHRVNKHNDSTLGIDSIDINTCEICNKVFVTQNELKNHLSQEHNLINEWCLEFN